MATSSASTHGRVHGAMDTRRARAALCMQPPVKLCAHRWTDALRVRLDEAGTCVREATLARQLAVSAKLRYDFNSWLGERRVLVGDLSRGCAITYKLSRWQ